MLLVALTGCQTPEEGAQVKKGAKVGAVGGALLGVTMGALTGDAKMAAAGMAVGAAAGGAAGGMYEYEQSRDDRRTKMLADSIGGANKGETMDQAGTRHLNDLLGDWSVAIWELGADGKHINAAGTAKGMMDQKNQVRFEYQDIVVEGYDVKLTGVSRLAYDPEAGFTLENKFSLDEAPLSFVGEYVAVNNAYNFYQLDSDNPKSRTGLIRTNVRIEMRITGTKLIVANTFALVDGKEVQVQSYRFTRK